MDTGFIPTPERPALHAFLRDEAFISRARDRALLLDGQDGDPPIDDIDELSEAGLLRAPLPRRMGGRGWGTEPEGALELFDALRLVGRISLPLGRLYEGHVNSVRLACRHGTEAQREAVAACVRDGQLFGVWNTERPDRALEMRDGRFRGGKVLCSGIGLVRQALVTARPSGGGPLQMWLVPLAPFDRRGDLSEWRPSGMRASATGSIDLDGIDPAECLRLGGPDDYMAQPDFSGGAWRFLAAHLGGIEAIAEELRQHLIRTGRERDPHQSARFGEALTAAETARLWVRQACLVVESGEAEADRAVAHVDLARGAVERAALQVMELTQRSIGLQAFMASHPVERLLRDLATYLRQPAPDRALTAGAAAGFASVEKVGDMWP